MKLFGGESFRRRTLKRFAIANKACIELPVLYTEALGPDCFCRFLRCDAAGNASKAAPHDAIGGGIIRVSRAIFSIAAGTAATAAGGAARRFGALSGTSARQVFTADSAVGALSWNGGLGIHPDFET